MFGHGMRTFEFEQQCRSECAPTLGVTAFPFQPILRMGRQAAGSNASQRIIYGPEYTLPEHLERLRERGLSGKRSLALREFAVGIEGLERFVQREPLRRVHECVFGVLALESEPVDPRL